MIEFRIGLDSLDSLIKELYPIISSSKIVLLRGNLASGKTTFVKKFVEHLGAFDCVTSPTFSLVQNYDNRVLHYDLYNSSSEKFLELGLFEEFDGDKIHFIEWADEKLIGFLTSYGYDYLIIEIVVSNNQRVYRILD